MIISSLSICFMPVSVTSFISDYHKYYKNTNAEASNEGTNKLLTNIFGESTLSEITGNISQQDSKEAAARKFLAGFIAGETVVLFCIFHILSSYMEYVMIKRLRKFIAARKGLHENETLA
ncbi:hypothetical protein L5515_009274 [Caenorhabditis briggsae]|uniref:Uncharacterized protein n=1 Tax=Caenorhabditis briggsae TaxID=6238 RepID=A0AAE9F8D0_CAEBR|nr:hypothetical protein L5515_009274 [Caenorhabditis briggsae]